MVDEEPQTEFEEGLELVFDAIDDYHMDIDALIEVLKKNKWEASST